MALGVLLAQSVDDLGPIIELINGDLGVAALVLLSLFKGWLIIGKTAQERLDAAQDRLDAEKRRADDAEKREKWWQEIAVRQGNLLPSAVKGFEEATVIALERQS